MAAIAKKSAVRSGWRRKVSHPRIRFSQTKTKQTQAICGSVEFARYQTPKFAPAKTTVATTIDMTLFICLLVYLCGADSRIRTDDLHFTKVLLYQLSYIGKKDIRDGAGDGI